MTLCQCIRPVWLSAMVLLLTSVQASDESDGRPRRFKPQEIGATLPDTSDKLLVDKYLVDTEAASSRVFRVFKPMKPHHHNQCDEYLYVLSGRGTFWMENPNSEAEFGPGDLLYFKRTTVHALPKLIEQPIVFLSFDTPRRSPDDIHFEDPKAGSAADWGHDKGSDEL